MSISKKIAIPAFIAAVLGAHKAYSIVAIITLQIFFGGLDTFDDDNRRDRRRGHHHNHHRGHHGGVVVAGSTSSDDAGIFAFIILLDGDQGAEFSEITTESANILGVGPHEAEVFNDSLDEINMTYKAFLLDTHKKGLSKSKRRAVWDEKFRSALDEETAQVFEKVAKANAQLAK